MPAESETAAPRRFDMGELRRLGLWGIASAAAMAVVAFAATSDSGQQRLALLFAKLEHKPEHTASVPIVSHSGAEARKLAEAVRLLTADRDRLTARVESLERSLGEMTGSIARMTPAAAAAFAPPAIAAPDTAATPAPAPWPAEPNPNRLEFGLDLGTAPNVENLRALWIALRSKHAGTLDGMRPIVSIRENTRTGGVELRLVAGPIANAAAAAKLCSILVGNGAICQPALFDGQRLVMR